MVKLRLLILITVAGIPAAAALHAEVKRYAAVVIDQVPETDVNASDLKVCTREAENRLRAHGFTVTSDATQPGSVQLIIRVGAVQIPTDSNNNTVYVAAAALRMGSTLDHAINTYPALAIGGRQPRLSQLCTELAESVLMNKDPW